MMEEYLKTVYCVISRINLDATDAMVVRLEEVNVSSLLGDRFSRKMIENPVIFASSQEVGAD